MKMQKTSHLNEQEIEEFRAILTSKRQQLAQTLASLDEGIADQNRTETQDTGNSTVPTHPADIGTDAYERELSMRLQIDIQRELVEVDDALGRIEEGTYGLCMATGEPISKERLRAKPWARYSLQYVKDNGPMESF
jgi:DnaK suppressor protein